MPANNFIFNLRMCISNLRMHIFSLRMCILRLKMKKFPACPGFAIRANGSSIPGNHQN